MNVRRGSLWTVATATLGIGLAVLAGCDGADGAGGPASPGTAEPAPQPTAGAVKLTVDQNDADIVSGTLTDGVSTLAFEGRALGGQKYDVTLRLNGAVLTAMGDAEARYHTLDGFAASNGGDTQLDSTEGAALRALEKALDQYNFDHQGGTFIARQTVHVSSVFGELANSTTPLQQEVIGNNDRTPTMLCTSFIKWIPATHDCDQGFDYQGGQWAFASVGERFVRNGGVATRQFFADEPFWHDADFSHKGGSYISGNCLGHCGTGCPAGNQFLTMSCLHHDQCTSGNHVSGSFWCSDEYSAAAGDVLDGGPICAGTGQDPPAAVAWQNNFPNQGVERKVGTHAICYSMHIADFGWTPEVCDNSIAGSTGISKMGQAIKIRAINPNISVCYTVTMAGISSPMTACNGAMAGTTGQSRRMETIRIFTNRPPDGRPLKDQVGTTLTYQTHVDVAGWLSPVPFNTQTGIAGKSIQAITIKMCEHGVCTNGSNLVAASCDDPCVGTVCAGDSFCCNNAWDDICIGEATQWCGTTCP
jgi:hypothetical protein